MFFDKFTQRLFPTKWGNKVSKWLNNVVGDGYVQVYSPDSPSPENPPRIALDFDTLVASLQNAGIGGGGALQPNTYENGANATEKLANARALAALAPKADAIVDDVVTSRNTNQVIADAAVARIGTSSYAAREDHQHPSLLRSTTTTNFTSSQLTTLSGNAPKACKQVTSTETTAQKIARMGSSAYAAREDHEHPSEIRSLSEAVATLASHAPVALQQIVPTSETDDQKKTRLGSSTYAAREDHVHPSELRSLSEAVATLASHAPVAPQIVSTSETNAQKKTRLGTSTYAAREDHVHPVPYDSAAATAVNSGSRYNKTTNASSAGSAPKTDTWSRASATAGIKLKVYTRSWNAAGETYFYFRELTFDKFGALVNMSAETVGDYCTGGFS